jgi:hypothetical protein
VAICQRLQNVTGWSVRPKLPCSIRLFANSMPWAQHPLFVYVWSAGCAGDHPQFRRSRGRSEIRWLPAEYIPTARADLPHLAPAVYRRVYPLQKD